MGYEGSSREGVSRQWISWLHSEIDLWKQEGIISEEQSSDILKRYAQPEVNIRAEDRKSSKFIAMISILGSILLGVGVILFFAHNWKFISIPVKLGIIFGLITATYMVGYWMAFEKKIYTGAGKALIFLGVLFFGAGIWLIAQIFNINAHYPNGMLYWSLGGLLVAYITRLKPIIALTIALLTIWTVMEQSGFYNVNYLYLILMLVTVIPLVYKEKSRLGAVLAVISFSIWLSAANISWQTIGLLRPSPSYIAGSLLVFFIFLYAFSKVQRSLFNAPGMESPLKVVALFGIFIMLYAMTFRGMEDLVRKASSISYLPMDSIIIYVTLIISLLGLIGYNYFKATPGRNARYEEIGLLLMVLVSLAYMVVPVRDESVLAGIYPYTLAINILFLGMVVFVLALGFRERKPVFINMALIFFLIDVVTRYFDYLWKLLDRSIFFMAGGLALLVGGIILEKRRRKIISELR
ncbi:MAG: DUF2157 domain-containing protein [Clostridia bacterium]|nr:DUF2157 domain-containing protein [Clostridia bacterium]